MEMSTQSIETIFIKPKTSDVYTYVINGNREIHSMRHLDLRQFLIKTIGVTDIPLLDTALDTYRNFIVIVSTKEIIILEPDLEKEREDYLEDFKQNNSRKSLLQKLKLSKNIKSPYEKDLESSLLFPHAFKK